MMWDYTLDYLELLDQRRKRRLEVLSSPAELVRLQRRVRAKSAPQGGPPPAERP